MTEPTPPVFVPPPGPLPPQERWRVLESIKDNIEAFTIALIMALVIKHFCVEAFKIPTGSMEPTLFGESNHGVGDRILVDKLAYLTQDPERWDVIVFRFPLNKAKHFIKRVGGVGPEYLRIHRGEIWTRKGSEDPWRIAKKPRRTREELYVPVFPVTSDPSTSADTWWRTQGAWSVEAPDRLRFAGGEPATVEFLKRVGRNSSSGWEGVRAVGSLARDLRFRMRIVPEGEGEGALAVRWRTADDETLEVRLAPGESVAGLRRGGSAERIPLPVVWQAGRPVDLEIEDVDGAVHVHLDGREVVAIDTERDIDDDRAFDDFTQELTFEAEGGAVTVSDFRVDRDLNYERSSDMDYLEEGDQGLYVPEDHYFVLGDNTGSSHDSRKWDLYHVPLADGTEVVYYYDQDNPPRREGDLTIVTDHDGLERAWRQDDVVTPPGRTSVRSPFVPRRLVVGRAFLVFWPLFPDFPGRFGFIR